MSADTAREAVAQAISEDLLLGGSAVFARRFDIADAAISAHLESLGAGGYVVVPVTLLEDLADPGPCQWDHNHSCQAHGYFYLRQGTLCPNEDAKQRIAAAEANR